MTENGVALEAVEASGRGAIGMFLRNKAAVFGLCMFAGIVLMNLFGPALYGVDSDDMVARPFSGPGEGAAPLLAAEGPAHL